jgi:hypothetical protein
MGNSSYHLFKKHYGNSFKSYLYETCFYFQCSNEFFAPSLNYKSTYFYVVLASSTNNVIRDILSYVLTYSRSCLERILAAEECPFPSQKSVHTFPLLSCAAIIIRFWPDF